MTVALHLRSSCSWSPSRRGHGGGADAVVRPRRQAHRRRSGRCWGRAASAVWTMAVYDSTLYVGGEFKSPSCYISAWTGHVGSNWRTTSMLRWAPWLCMTTRCTSAATSRALAATLQDGTAHSGRSWPMARTATCGLWRSMTTRSTCGGFSEPRQLHCKMGWRAVVAAGERHTG